MFQLRNFMLVVALGGAAGLVLGSGTHSAIAADEVGSSTVKEDSGADSDRKILYYRNPMGLADTSPVPKKDSMGMDYVPVYADDEQPSAKNGDDSGAEKGAGGIVRLTPERVQRLGVKSELVERRNLSKTIHAVGTVQMDESKQSVIAPRYEGYIEKLVVNTTGQNVKKEDVLLTFYSPQLIQIENEYLVSRFGNGDVAHGRVNGSLERLRTLGVPDEEIQRLQREKTVNNSISLRATADGTVLEKQALDGMKFLPGDTLYRLADLSSVWVMARVYEKDMALVSLNQPVTMKFDAYPDRTFEGKVVFIYPDIDVDTRTAKVRIELPNAGGDLRLSMFADVMIESPVVSNALSIPVSAVLDSGERQSVLVDLGEGRFRAQQIKIGQRTENYVQILGGLKDGERVVTSSSFLIDAESNIRAALQNFSAPEKKHD